MIKKHIAALAALLLVAATGVAVALVDYPSVRGSAASAVQLFLDGSSQAVAVSASNPLPISSSASASLTLVPLDVATVTTGGTAVTALTAGHRNRGGWLANPDGATISLCINEQTTAAGTTSAGALMCILPGRSFNLVPSPLAVSVISSDSAHPFAGEGFN